MKLTTNLKLKIPEDTDLLDFNPILDNFASLDTIVHTKAEKSQIPTKLSQLQEDVQVYHNAPTPTTNTNKMWLDTSI